VAELQVLLLVQVLPLLTQEVAAQPGQVEMVKMVGMII
jgi:hypothetical protein